MTPVAVWASAPNDVWLGTPLAHYDGTGKPVPVPSVDAVIADIHGLAQNDVYATGWKSAPHDGLIYHFDGSGWTQTGAVGVTVFAIHERASSELYFATAAGLRRSSDQGVTSTVVTGIGCSVESVTGVATEIDATGFCGPQSFLFRSTDGGATFAKIAIGALQGTEVATRDGTLYITGHDSSNAALLRSTDGGATLVNIEPSSPFYGHGMWLDSANELWIATDQGLAHTSDGGASWSVGIGTTLSMSDITAAGAHDLYAVGMYTVNGLTPIFLHGTR